MSDPVAAPVIVLAGGLSPEHDVLQRSGQAVVAALAEEGVHATLLDLRPRCSRSTSRRA